MKIVITTRRVQNKKHHKRRIDKKWAKRYGFTEYEVQEKGRPIISGGVIYLTYEDFNKIAATLGTDKQKGR